MVEIYSDGSCFGGLNKRDTDNLGGSAIVIIDTDSNTAEIHIEIEKNTTNNRQELKGLYSAIKYCNNHKDSTFNIYCDSAYCVNTYNSWMTQWAENGWTRKGSKPLENLDLIKSIYYESKFFPKFRVLKTKGHSGIVGNELADAAAKGDTITIAKLLNKYKIELKDFSMRGDGIDEIVD